MAYAAVPSTDPSRRNRAPRPVPSPISAPSPAARHVLFDFDSTLVDITLDRAAAWAQALSSSRRPVTAAQVLAFLDRTPDAIVRAFRGRDDARSYAEATRAIAETIFDRQYREHIFAVSDAVEGLRRVLARGCRVYLLTSGSQFHLHRCLERLDPAIVAQTGSRLSTLVSGMISADHAPTPAHTILSAAMARLRLPLEYTALVTGATCMAQAAQEAGLPVLAVQTQAATVADLRLAGAAEVYRDYADFLDRLPDSWLFRRGPEAVAVG